ncbi:MAG TPA: oxidoreductase-like domain-containing protein [Rhodocyclaceae bacterium]|nr:oxidoreductase-like domain-containing protein [Rhodocyclaceae bacterium]
MTQSPPSTDSPQDPPPAPPREPDALDCCDSGCGDACVWTIYRLAKDKYDADLEAWQIRQLLKD